MRIDQGTQRVRHDVADGARLMASFVGSRGSR